MDFNLVNTPMSHDGGETVRAELLSQFGSELKTSISGELKNVLQSGLHEFEKSFKEAIEDLETKTGNSFRILENRISMLESTTKHFRNEVTKASDLITMISNEIGHLRSKYSKQHTQEDNFTLKRTQDQLAKKVKKLKKEVKTQGAGTPSITNDRQYQTLNETIYRLGQQVSSFDSYRANLSELSQLISTQNDQKLLPLRHSLRKNEADLSELRYLIEELERSPRR